MLRCNKKRDSCCQMLLERSFQCDGPDGSSTLQTGSSQVLCGTIPKLMNNIPSVLAIVLCDWIIIEQGTGKKTLVGLFDNLNAPAFPFLRPLGFYARLTDLDGDYKFDVRVVRLEGAGEELMARAEAEFKATDRLATLSTWPASLKMRAVRSSGSQSRLKGRSTVCGRHGNAVMVRTVCGRLVCGRLGLIAHMWLWRAAPRPVRFGCSISRRV